MAAPTGYESSSADYTNAGFIYVAAVRYIRYNEGIIAGDTERIFTFGMSGGGAQSALMGATGDSDMYTAYLEEIGAVMSESDAVAGSIGWNGRSLCRIYQR